VIRIKDLNFTAASGFTLSIGELSVREGEVLAIIGPNGAGKTSLLNVLALFLKADSGRLELFGGDAGAAGALALRRAMSFVFSRPYLVNDTVYNNIRLPLKLRGIRDTGQIAGMLELFKITGLKDRGARELSQGERHRVALARAFVTGPKLVLLDEPFSSLDARARDSITRDLRGIIKSANTTVVLVTQDHSEALVLSDSMAVMKDGRILQRGAPREFFARPVSKEVADFVGVETILAGEIAGKSGSLCSIKVGDTLLEAVSEYNEGDSVLVCVRPEAVTVSKTGESGSMRNHFKARVVSIEPWRLEYKIGLDCGFDLLSFVTAQSVEGLGLKVNDELFASFKAAAVHLIKRQGPK
jgi:tungstate transport system ATP-binding protein